MSILKKIMCHWLRTLTIMSYHKISYTTIIYIYICSIGSRASFCIYGLLSGCVLAGFLYVRKKASEIEDEVVKVDDSEALGGYGAPQGVPSAIPGKIAQTVPTQDIDYQW